MFFVGQDSALTVTFFQSNDKFFHSGKNIHSSPALIGSVVPTSQLKNWFGQ